MSQAVADQRAILDHARAKDAALVVDKRAKDLQEKDFKKYRTVVLSAGTAIRQTGLLQFTAFCLSKGGERALVLADLCNWLSESSATKWLINRDDLSRLQAAELMTVLLEHDAWQIAALEAEAQHYLVWLKRLTEGVRKELERGEPDLATNEH